jgi:hypothetical protein
MEFDEEVAVLLRGGDVVDSKTEAESDSADGFEQRLIARCARFGVDDDVGGNDLGDALLDFVGEGVNLFEIGGARNADGSVNEVAVAGATEADAFHVENSFNISDLGNELILQPRGSGVEKGVEGAAAELRTDPEDHAGDGKASERVGVSEPGKIPDIASPDESDAEDDDNRAPDIG